VSKCHAIPVFATAAPGAILVPMPTLEINATQPWLISFLPLITRITRMGKEKYPRHPRNLRLISFLCFTKK
jgi:hypothetical protein